LASRFVRRAAVVVTLWGATATGGGVLAGEATFGSVWPAAATGAAAVRGSSVVRYSRRHNH
jgi:hypothetical protein